MTLRGAAIIPILLFASCTSSQTSSTSSSAPAPNKANKDTYIALDSTNDWRLGPNAGNLKLSADNGWKIEPHGGTSGGLAFMAVRPSDPDADKHTYDIEVRAPGGKPFELKRYECPFRAPSDSKTVASHDFSYGSSTNYFSGWFQVYEVDIAPDNSAVNHFSADVLLMEEDHAAIYARIRYKATVDPQLSPADIQKALSGK